MIRTAVLGYGVVGKGTVDIINAKREQLKSKTGQDIDVKYILVRHDYDSDYKEKFVYDFETILNDSDVNIVIEAIGGKHPAYEYIKSALSAGKSVVTSNKELVAAYGAELMAVAKEKNVNFIYPVSSLETNHRVTLADGREFTAMCAIDAMGAAFTFHQDTEVHSVCAMCEEPVYVKIVDGKVADYAPKTLHALTFPLGELANWAGSC